MTMRTSWAATLFVVACCALASTAVRIVAMGQPQQTAALSEQGRQDILAFHTKDEKGGSAEAGRPLFDERCAACHRFGEIGRDVGPDLTTITSRFKKRDILESILWPSKVISDQYQSEMFELTGGKTISGVIVRETATAVMVRTAEAPDKPVAVSKAQISTRTPATVSLMPDSLLEGLSPTQIADLLAFVMAPVPSK